MVFTFGLCYQNVFCKQFTVLYFHSQKPRKKWNYYMFNENLFKRKMQYKRGKMKVME